MPMNLRVPEIHGASRTPSSNSEPRRRMFIDRSSRGRFKGLEGGRCLRSHDRIHDAGEGVMSKISAASDPGGSVVGPTGSLCRISSIKGMTPHVADFSPTRRPGVGFDVDGSPDGVGDDGPGRVATS
jgi:hypothetical protein